MTAPKLQYKKMKIEELIILAQQDDIKALEELLRCEQKNIFATFTYLSKSRQNISDLTQEALLRVAKNLKNLKNPKHFKSWLNQIVTHLFYDELRKLSRKPDVISIDEDKDDEHPSNIKNTLADNHCKPYEKCLSVELEDVIRTEINNLPQHFRIAIVLRELQGLSYEEIANITNVTIGTVKSRIARARGRLQENLKNYI
ncbi:sigma-70 family RNA polymerase sigma factor [bacterium]|nr:sigma-70 family RNA polymerase sigma factor [bacterium]